MDIKIGERKRGIYRFDEGKLLDVNTIWKMLTIFLLLMFIPDNLCKKSREKFMKNLSLEQIRFFFGCCI